MNKKIGFIGQGWIGRNYADDFEKRGFEVVRYALDEQYNGNKEKIKDCDIVFIAVPTPTTPAGFDDSVVRQVVKLVGDGKIAVIKSTLLPGTTKSIQEENNNLLVIHSPEFLREVSAAEDAANPKRNIIGIPVDDEKFKKAALAVMDVLPKAPYSLICNSQEAELIKYGGNCFLYSKVVFMNLLYDLSSALGCDWKSIKEAMVADDRIGSSHMEPVHDSGRGAGGHCFIKDFAAFSELYKKNVNDPKGNNFLDAMEGKNIDLLSKSGKDTESIKDVYGDNFIK